MSNTLDTNMIDPTKNSAKNLEYYDELVKFFEQDDSDTLLKLRSFSLYTPRQVVTEYLVRYELFKQILNVPGSILEFGVFNGQGLMSFAQFSAILEPNHISRKVFGFDTFEGFKSLGEGDKGGTSKFLNEGGFRADSFSRIERAVQLYDLNRFIGHVSKVELTRGDVVEVLEEFLESHPHLIAALVYLDMDIYEPTKHVLQKLMARVPKGGIVAFDELNTADFPGETLAVMDTLGLGNCELKRFPFCSRTCYFVR